MARRSGLFLQTKVPDLGNGQKNKVLGEFIHLSIQEFLAMLGLLTQRPGSIKEALKTLKTSGQFNMALLFLYGFAFDNKDETLTKLCTNTGINRRLDDNKDVQEHLQRIICVSDTGSFLLEIDSVLYGTARKSNFLGQICFLLESRDDS